MDGFQLYRRPTGSSASTPRNGTPGGPEKYVSSGVPNGGGLEVRLGPLPSRQAHAASRPSGYGGKGLDEGYPTNSVVVSNLNPHFKRKAEGSEGPTAAIKTAVKNAVAAATSSPATPALQKKRGRPKGWKPGMAYSETTNNPRSEAARLLYVQRRMRENPNYQLGHHGRAPGRPPGRPPGPGRADSKPVGRPVGRPPGSSSGALKGPPKPRGRPPKKPPPTPREIYLSLKPRFEPYRCEWSGCQAELHNMATLRAHVHKVHGGSTGCKWASCTQNSATGAPTTASFPSGDLLAHHMEKVHMIPVQWLRGDGFKAGPISSAKTTTTASYDENGEAPAIPSYLLDKDGKELTPWVWYQKLEDNATRLANKKRLQQTLFQMNEDAPSEGEGDEDGAGEDG